MGYKIVSQTPGKYAKVAQERYLQKREEHKAHVKRNKKERGIVKYREYQRDYRVKLRLRLLMFLGGKCESCGINDTRVLQLDHINGGGTKEIKKLRNTGVYKRAFENPAEYQVLCANCNWIKRYENNEHRQHLDS